MKTRKKLLIALLSATCLTAGAFGLAACDKETNDPALYGIYNAYVAEANQKNETPLSYEDWLKDKFSSVGQKGDDGEDGDDGQPGENGKSAYEIYLEAVYKENPDATPMTEAQWLASLNGVTPHIGDNGNWYLGTIDTQVKAAGVDGINGVGIKGIAMSADGTALEVTFTDDSVKSVPLPEYITHKHTYGNEYTVIIPATGEYEGIGYKVCTQNGCEHIELVTIGSYSYKITVYLSDIIVGGEESVGTVAAGAKVTLKGADGKTVAEVTTDENGEAVFNDIEKGAYNVVVEKDGFVAVNMEGEGELVTSKNASEYSMVLLTSLKNGGADDHTTGDVNHAYQITTELDGEAFLFDTVTTWQVGQVSGYYPSTTYVDFTAPETGVYNFIAKCFNIGINAPVNGENGLLTGVVLNKGEKYRLAVDMGSVGDYDNYYSDSQLSKFMIAVTRGDSLAGKEGTEACPIAVDANGKTTYTAKADHQVFFKITASAGMAAKYKITFDSTNVGVIAIGTNIDANGDVLASGNYVNFGVSEVYYSTSYYLLVSAKDGNIEFTVEDYYINGEKNNPIEVELGTEYDSSTTGLYETWYKLDVETARKLTLERTSEDAMEFRLYRDVDSATSEILSADINPYDFEAGTYYILVSGDCTFKVRAYNTDTDIGNSADDPLTLDAGEKFALKSENKYFKFVADKDGKFAVNVFDDTAYIYVYSDENFENINTDFSSNSYVEVKEGDVLYIRAYSYYGASISFSVVGENEKVDYVVKVVTGYGLTPPPAEGAVVTVKKADGTPVEGVSATTDENGVAVLNLEPGVYTVVLALDGVDFGTEKYEYSGNTTLRLSYGTTTTTINLTQVYSYSYTLKFEDEVLPGIKVTYGGKEYTTDDDGKVTLWANYISSSDIEFALEGTDYEGYTTSFAWFDGEADNNYVVTLKAPLPPAPKVDWGTLTGDKEVDITERTEFTFRLDEAPMDVDGYDCYLDVTGGYIEFLSTSNEPSGGIPNGNAGNTWYNFNSWSSRSVTVIIVVTGETANVKFTYATV